MASCGWWRKCKVQVNVGCFRVLKWDGLMFPRVLPEQIDPFFMTTRRSFQTPMRAVTLLN
jgi:hypothetical protein